MPLTYPDAHRDDVVDTFYGTEVPDPYRWLEQVDAPDTRAWVKAEEKLSRRFLDDLPDREAVRDRLLHLWNYERFGVPFQEGGWYFYDYNPGLKNQSVLYVMDGLEGEPRVLLDPNTLSEDGTVAVTGRAVSRDGTHLAYALSTAGSDWMTWHVRDVATGKDLPDEVRWSKFSGASWAHDGSGFFYSAYDAPEDRSTALTAANYDQKLFFHRLGTPQSADRLVYARPDHKEWGFSGTVTDDGRYLVIGVWRGTDPKNQLFYEDLHAEHPKVVELLGGFDAKWQFVGNEGRVFHLHTDLQAPRGRIVALDLDHPSREAMREVVPEGKDTLQAAGLVGGHLVLRFLADAKSRVAVHDLSGELSREVALPGLGAVEGFGGHADDPETFFAYTSFTTPTTIYRYDVETGKAQVFRRPEVDFDPDAFVTEQVFYESKDGTRVPMFIVHAKGLERDGKNKTYLYGYGGFDHALTPVFSVSLLVWMQRGGIFAMPNLRGGGEYGEAWHLSGTKLHKQNVFDDFIAAAEWLIHERYTATPKLAIGGGSNGGLLVGACLTQRPDLFGAAVPQVGVLDMLRYQKWTIGWAWASDYGTVDDGKEMFEALYAYSPYHNVGSGTPYPPTLIFTGDHDDRVMPAHSFKLAARMQHLQGGDAPILLRVETRAGHGAGKPTDKVIDELADRWAFLDWALDRG